MSFLAPLYLLGALAVIGPIVFHLIRQTPKGEVPFSSLMFLAPTPPKLTRRSRLDDWPLLLLRLLALVLLVLGFGRPFLRQAASLAFGEDERRRVAILVDTSASMRRGDLWPKAVARAKQAIAESRPGDQLALIGFDATTRTLLGFDESARLDPARRQAVALSRLATLAPTWASTDLGRALVDAVAAVEDVGDASEKAGRMPRRVVLVSDLQGSSRLDTLGDFEWPTDVVLSLMAVAEGGSNATLERLADSNDSPGSSTPSEADADSVRVRVANDPGSKRESFRLAWVGPRGEAIGPPVAAYVPPGESRVVRVPRPARPSTALRLAGDDHPFDDTIHFAAEAKREEATVLFVGPDKPDDPSGLLYYLLRVFDDDPRRPVRVVARKPDEPPVANEGKAALAVVAPTGPVPGSTLAALEEMIRGGGTVLYLAGPAESAAGLASLAGSGPLTLADSPAGRDALLGEVAFDHPLFASLAGPQFNDFTKIHFWKHRRLDPKALGDARVLARFDDGDPAVLEKPIGQGRLVALTSGWAPADSQLARSSKFVPLMAALLDGRRPRPLGAGAYIVGDRVAMPPASEGRPTRMIRKPDGTTATVAAGETYFASTDEPGVYSVEGAGSFAVNLDPAEGRVAPLAVERLEQLGVRMATAGPGPADRERIRQMQNAELEGRQKLWRWPILAAIVTLIVETWLAASRGRARPTRAEALAT